MSGSTNKPTQWSPVSLLVQATSGALFRGTSMTDAAINCNDHY